MFIRTGDGFINIDKSNYIRFHQKINLEIVFDESTLILLIDESYFEEVRELIKRGILGNKRIIDLSYQIISTKEVLNGK